MKRKYLFILLLPFLFNSCENKVLKISKPSINPILGRGEWLDTSDTLNGISVRKDKIAFFEKMKFFVDQIQPYYIIDSIYKEGEVETQKKEYLFIDTLTDTLSYQIVKRNDKIIILEDAKGIQKTYTFWR